MNFNNDDQQLKERNVKEAYEETKINAGDGGDCHGDGIDCFDKCEQWRALNNDELEPVVIQEDEKHTKSSKGPVNFNHDDQHSKGSDVKEAYRPEHNKEETPDHPLWSSCCLQTRLSHRLE